uniref:Uncharacterized protein n=1 Tax=Amazona collaria TaxID=241587 RepID=A0A8B9FMR2_9PSIT
MRSAMEMHSKARLWQARTVSGAPPGSGASLAPALLPLAAMRAPQEKRSQSHAKSSPSWKATKRSRAKAAKSGNGAAGRLQLPACPAGRGGDPGGT